MTHTESVNTQLIPVAKLEISTLNVRKTQTQAGIDEIKASILAHGLIQNLSVTAAHGGTYHVVAGGRRLAALRQLQDEGTLPAEFAVPCRVVTQDEAAEMSLAENSVRLAMHPADEFEAFAALIDQGQTAAQVALRFGVEESVVVKRMKLASVSPELLQAYRGDAMTLECLMAFAITDDHARQLRVFQSLQGWQKDDPRHIRSVLKESMVDAGSTLARFVGLDAYEAAGGTIRADLFGNETYLENPELLDALVAEKLRLIEQQLKTEGWAWIEISPQRDWAVTSGCGRIHPVPAAVPQELLDKKARIEAELATIEAYYENAFGDDQDEAGLEATEQRQEQLEAELLDLESSIECLATYDFQQMHSAGCYVTINHDGELSIEKGLVRRQDMKLLAGSQDAKERKPKGMPETLRRDLEAYRLQAAQVEIARHPAIAFDLLVFNVARYALATRPVYDGPDVHFTQHYGTPAVNREQTAAADALEAIRHGLPAEWLDHDAEGDQFVAFRQLSNADKRAILGYCTATTLQAKLAPGDGDEPTAYDLALLLTAGDVAAYWRPTRDNYLSRITRDQLLAIGRDVLGEQWAQSRWKDKKGELADQLDRAFAAPDQAGRTPEQSEKLRRWLPAGMDFALAEAPALPVAAESGIAA